MSRTKIWISPNELLFSNDKQKRKEKSADLIQDRKAYHKINLLDQNPNYWDFKRLLEFWTIKSTKN